MPRRPRLALAGIPWHIIQRGNNRSACFYADVDYRYYLVNLEEQAQKYQCHVHAYVLMTNHVHILLTPIKAENVSLMMKNLGQRYAQYVNRTYRRTGTLWEGRFRSCLTQDELYALTCHQYIEFNPVRAGMVNDPSEYPWSSYRSNALGDTNTLLTPHFLYSGLGQTGGERQTAYRDMFRDHIEAELMNDIRQATNGNFVLGNDKFIENIESKLNRRVRPGKSGRPKNVKGNSSGKLF